MTRIYEGEKQAMLHGRSSSSNLVTSLIRDSQEMAEAADADTVNEKRAMPRHKQGGLAEDEVDYTATSLFFNFAGHDTTAHTLAFGIVLLATRPDVQDWIAEEVHNVLGDQEAENWSCCEAFPKLKRCLAVLVRSTDICHSSNDKPITLPTHSTKRCASVTRSPS